MECESLLQCLLDLSEQASNLARLIREDADLFKLLIASKEQRINGEADFKTLADVLIQATFRYGVLKRFPEFNINVMGEEDNTFPTKSGNVNLDLNDNVENTRTILSQILADSVVVEKLTNAVHNTVQVHDDLVKRCKGVQLPHVLHIWIDPIDSTKSYISGKDNLESVTVLVGVHHAGVPILGVMTYPFTKTQIWGLSYNKHNVSSVPPVPDTYSPVRTVLLSSMEGPELRDKLTGAGYRVETPAGAGHKLGGVILGTASFYCTTIEGTFQWDTCGPHAILRALGGDIVEMKNTAHTMLYDDSREANQGFIAYSSKTQLDKLLNIL